MKQVIKVLKSRFNAQNKSGNKFYFDPDLPTNLSRQYNPFDQRNGH